VEETEKLSGTAAGSHNLDPEWNQTLLGNDHDRLVLLPPAKIIATDWAAKFRSSREGHEYGE
jgi:hypothetical protein